MHLIVGLGNPGEKYATTRHNVGFWALDALTENYTFSNWSEKFKGFIATGTIGTEKIILLKPMTFMNLSGESVQKAMAFYKLTPEDITVIHDEIDLNPQDLRIKTGGGSAGHNGLKSISQCLSSPEYQRIRIGVGHPAALGRSQEVSAYVLENFSKEEAPHFEDLCKKIAKTMPDILNGDTRKAVSSIKENS